MHGPSKEPRRNAPRINVRTNQIVYLNFQSGNGGIVLDVSENGLGFQAVDPLRTNELLPFRLSVPGFPQIKLSGLVAWVDESRKRGGLRVIVPDAQRPAFQLWQQYLGPPPEAEQPAAIMRGPDIVSQGQPEAKRFRISRNVLVGCLFVVLCAALADGSQFLSVVHRIGDLLSNSSRGSSATILQATSAASPKGATSLMRNSQRAAASGTQEPHSARTAGPGHNDARLFTPAASSSPANNVHSPADSVSMKPVASPAVASQSTPRLIAKASTASANHAAGKKDLNPASPQGVSNAWPTRSWPHKSLQASARSLSAATPDGPGIIPPGRSVAPKRLVAMDSSFQAPVSPPASQDLAAAAQSPAAFDSQPSSTSTNFEPCQLVSSVQPAYPQEARKQRVQGDVKLRLVVGTDGTVTNVAPVDGPPLLTAAAVNATRQFHYKPALLNGKPIETIQTVDISFKLER